MKTRLALAALSLPLMLATAAGVSASAPASRAPDAVVRAERGYVHGPSATYSGDSGGIGQVRALIVTVPQDAALYDAVVTVTTQYAATGKGPWTIGVSVGAPGRSDPVDTRPTSYFLGRTEKNRPETTTVRLLVRNLVGGDAYAFAPEVNSSFPGARGQSRISTSKVLMTVELTPSGS